MIAFCSAWSPRHISCRSPDGMPSFSRRHPRSAQCSTPEGAPLYPVARIFLSFTITAPTSLRRHVARRFTRCAISMKYSSQEGRVMISQRCTMHDARCMLPVVFYRASCILHPASILYSRLFHREQGELAAERPGPFAERSERLRRRNIGERLADQVADDFHLRFPHAACRHDLRTEAGAARHPPRLLIIGGAVLVHGDPCRVKRGLRVVARNALGRQVNEHHMVVRAA